MIKHLHGDCREVLKNLEPQSVNCCVTSPPYFGLRDYGVDGQLGMEETPEEYVQNMIDVFREVKRVLRDDGTIWINLGDSYAGSGKGQTKEGAKDPKQPKLDGMKLSINVIPTGCKSKDLIGIPWMVAFALRADGWYLRSDIIWHKLNPMPESVTDRPTKSHEYIFLLSKSQQYYYDHEAIKERSTTFENRPHGVVRDREYDYDSKQKAMGRKSGNSEDCDKAFLGHAPTNYARCGETETRNKRSVWSMASAPFKGAHFAVFPPDLIRPCILAGCPPKGTVIDCFGGSGTTALVSEQEGRDCILIELNEAYIELQKERTSQTSLLSL